MTTIHNGNYTGPQNTNHLSRNDPVNRWGNVISSFQAIPGLVGFWPMSSVQKSTGHTYDLSGQGRTLIYNGNPTYNIYNGMIPYIDLDGTGDYLSLDDELDLRILGTETIYNSSVRGLTVGGWFWLDSTGAAYPLISKWNDQVLQKSFALSGDLTVFSFAASSDGATSNMYVSSSVAYEVSRWYFVVGKFEPSTRMSVFVNGLKDSTTTTLVPPGLAMPASIFSGTANFMIGTTDRTPLSPSALLNGRASMCFLSANALPDVLIFSLFEQSRVLFNV